MKAISYNPKIIRSFVVAIFFVALALFFWQSNGARAAEDRKGGLHSYAYPAQGILSRSGYPNNKQLSWLGNRGRKSLINLIPNSENKGRGDVTKQPNFKRLDFKYLYLPIGASKPPTEKQVKVFLNFIKNKANQPAHIYCKAGNARTGVMMAIYRYSVQGWPMAKAIKESKRFGGGLSKKQKAWLLEWARTRDPGQTP